MEVNKILQGNSLEVLKTLPDEFISCIVTSPPYWALRDYGTAKWEGGNNPDCEHKVGRESRSGLTDKQKSNTGSFGDESIKNGEYCPGRRKELSGQKHADFKLEHPDLFKGYSDCGCNAGFYPGIVLDPFMGSGTTALVSLKLNRKFLGIELNPKYIEIAEARIKPFLVQKTLNSEVVTNG